MKHDGYRMVILLYVSIKFSEIMFPGLYKLHEILDNGKMKSTNSLVVAYKGPKKSFTRFVFLPGYSLVGKMCSLHTLISDNAWAAQLIYGCVRMVFVNERQLWL